MAFLTTWSDTNKIVDEHAEWQGYLATVTQGDETPPRWTVKQVEDKFRHVGMTYATAVNCAIAYNAQANTKATLQRSGEAGQYSVSVHQTTRTVTRVT